MNEKERRGGQRWSDSISAESEREERWPETIRGYQRARERGEVARDGKRVADWELGSGVGRGQEQWERWLEKGKGGQRKLERRDGQRRLERRVVDSNVKDGWGRSQTQA